jgi:sugar phosphate isomerase/epimerase
MTRFGFNARKDMPLEDSLFWAAQNGFAFVDFQADLPPNNIQSFEKGRVQALREFCDTRGLQIGIHTNSAINNAEYVPLMSDAVDAYMNLNVKLAATMGAGWVITHGGYHFSSDVDQRWEASLERLKRVVGWAEDYGVFIFLENHNKEPDDAEIHYIPRNVEETARFFESVESPFLRWSFNVAHGNLVPEGWAGFLDAFGVEGIGQVRLNDNRGDHEVHLVPGEGNVDFAAVFQRLKELNYGGPLILDFGTEMDKLVAREQFAALL